MRITGLMPSIVYLISKDHTPDFDFKSEQPKPYGEIERSGKSRKSDRKRAPKWGRRC